ncbi:MAG: HAD family hydrolase [Coriobacteriales bacterium]
MVDTIPAVRESAAGADPARTVAALFDLDGTLYTGHLWGGIAQERREHRKGQAQFGTFMTVHMSLYPLWRLGLIPESFYREMWTRHLGWTVRGWTEEEARRSFDWIAENYVLPLVRHDVMERVQVHKSQGHRVVLVSATPTQMLQRIGEHLGIDEVVGTPLVVKDGRYTGQSEQPTCLGEGKLVRARAHLDDGSVDWAASYAYADSLGDVPLLEAVGHPVAVHPDEKLAGHARSHGWEIIE